MPLKEFLLESSESVEGVNLLANLRSHEFKIAAFQNVGGSFVKIATTIQ